MSNTAQDQARAQVESICAMVAALYVDYDRLEELREMKADHESDPRENPRNWEQEYPDESEELAELESAAGDCESQEDAETRIQEDPLSVEVRSDWCAPGRTNDRGRIPDSLVHWWPHVELVGDIDDYQQPSRVRVLFKNWGESGELFDFDRETVLRYCQQFYFGE